MTRVVRHGTAAAIAAALVRVSPVAAHADTVDDGTPGHLVLEVSPSAFQVELDPVRRTSGS